MLCNGVVNGSHCMASLHNKRFRRFSRKKRFHGNACNAGYGLTSHSLCVCTLSADPISHCKLQTCPFENKANWFSHIMKRLGDISPKVTVAFSLIKSENLRRLRLPNCKQKCRLNEPNAGWNVHSPLLFPNTTYRF